MGAFTFVPVWVIEDAIIYLAAAATIFHIVKHEAQPVARLMEMFAFSVLASAVYENLATLHHYYGYGRSLIMIFNVPLSVPLFEYLVLYASLRLFEHLRMPTWLKALGAGFMGVVADFTLDPISVAQRFDTLEGTIGRWTWFPNPSDVQIYTEPVKNFSGWMLIIGYGAAFALLGRWWHRRSGYAPWVGIVYPILGALATLGVLITPLSVFLLNLWPFFAAGSAAEWVMLVVMLVAPPVLFAVLWRGRMLRPFTVRESLLPFLLLGGFPILNVVFTIATGHWQILWLEVLFLVVMEAALAALLLASRHAQAGFEIQNDRVTPAGAVPVSS
jgi:hypothetical protein